jgi:hypothetical protein
LSLRIDAILRLTNGNSQAGKEKLVHIGGIDLEVQASCHHTRLVSCSFGRTIRQTNSRFNRGHHAQKDL